MAVMEPGKKLNKSANVEIADIAGTIVTKLDTKPLVPKKKVVFDAAKWQAIIINWIGPQWHFPVPGLNGTSMDVEHNAIPADIKNVGHATVWLTEFVKQLDQIIKDNEKVIKKDDIWQGALSAEALKRWNEGSLQEAIAISNKHVRMMILKVKWMIACLDKPGVCDVDSVIDSLGVQYSFLEHTLQGDRMTYIHFLSVIEPIVNEINNLEAALQTEKNKMIAACGGDDGKKKAVEKFFTMTEADSKEILKKDAGGMFTQEIKNKGFPGIARKLKEIKDKITELSEQATTEGVKIADVNEALKKLGFDGDYVKDAMNSVVEFMKCAGGPTGFTINANGSGLAILLAEGAGKPVAEKVKEFVDNPAYSAGLPIKISDFTGNLLGGAGPTTPTPGPHGPNNPTPGPNGSTDARIADLQDKINTLTATINSIADQITALQNQGISGQISEQQMGEIKGNMAQMQAYLKNTDENTVKVGNHLIEVDKKIDGVQKQIGKLLEEGLPEKDDEEDEKKDKKKDPFDDLLKQLSEDDKDEKKEKKAEASEDNGMQQLMMMMMMMMNGQGNKSMNNMLPMMMMMMNDGKSM